MEFKSVLQLSFLTAFAIACGDDKSGGPHSKLDGAYVQVTGACEQTNNVLASASTIGESTMTISGEKLVMQVNIFNNCTLKANMSIQGSSGELYTVRFDGSEEIGEGCGSRTSSAPIGQTAKLKITLQENILRLEDEDGDCNVYKKS